MARPRLLFVCVENANRSQMAEAFARHLAGEAIDVSSAGSAPAQTVNPRAVAAMAELGIDLRGHYCKSVAGVEGPFAAVITLGCGDRCPVVETDRHEDWPLPDPRALEGDAFNTVRDALAQRVADLLTRLDIPLVRNVSAG